MNLIINKNTDIPAVIFQIKHLLNKNTNNKSIISEILILSSEILYNINKFSLTGIINIKIKDNTFFLEANDKGIGFSEIAEESIQEGYSSVNSLGLGLPTIIRIADELEITTSNMGTNIKCTKAL